MRNAPSTLAAAVMLAVFLFWGDDQSFAQICVSTSDNTCSGTYEDCFSSTASCGQSSDFQVSIAGTYTLGAKFSGCTNACNCNACVFVVKVSTGYVMGSTWSNCENQQCSSTTSVTLQSNTDYRLYICKRPCDADEDCTSCDSQCVAKGWLVSVPGPSCP